MKCLIIACGEGSRLKERGDSKPLVYLLGLPLIERIILIAQRAGLDDFYVVTGYAAEKLTAHLKRFGAERKIKITTIFNENWQKENGLSVYKAKDHIKENFILLMADHIFQSDILARLKEEHIQNGEVVLAVDHKIKNNLNVDLEDVTKVNEKNGKILNIGKKILEYNAFDTGIFLCTPKFFEALGESARFGNNSLSGGIDVLAKRGCVRTFNIDNGYWIDVDNTRMCYRAERMLLSNLKKLSDGPVARYFNRFFSIRATKWLVKTKITPNFISFLAFIISLTAAFFFFFGQYPYLVLGAILAQISSIVDGCDGEIARLRFLESKFGGWFDAVLDRYADGFLLCGLSYYVYLNSGNIWYLLIGFFAILGSFMNSYTADKYDAIMKQLVNTKKWRFRIGRDLRIFIIFLLSIFNLPLVAIFVIAIVANFENIRRILVAYKNR